ncbi:MAG: dienelactone hydrolase family protein [Snowella sp.]|nr:dienelactone hydrolase family protein [Snowella sp.]
MKRRLLKFGILGLLCALLLAGLNYQVLAQRSPDLTQQTWELHQHDFPLASPQLELAANAKVKGKWVTYGTLDNQPLKGYLARPAGAKADLPGLLVFHEWWGLNDNIQKMTEKLAAEGYTALALDLYGGQVAESPEKARALMQAAIGNQRSFDSHVKQAYQYLSTQKKASKIGTIGWCFGGTSSLNAALLLPQKIDATVIYYGSGIETNPDRLKTLTMPILGIFGELDQSIPMEKIKQFESALKATDKKVEIYVYPNADHAFANPSGTRYNQTAAEQAWSKTTAFLKQYLAP